MTPRPLRSPLHGSALFCGSCSQLRAGAAAVLWDERRHGATFLRPRGCSAAEKLRLRLAAAARVPVAVPHRPVLPVSPQPAVAGSAAGRLILSGAFRHSHPIRSLPFLCLCFQCVFVCVCVYFLCVCLCLFVSACVYLSVSPSCSHCGLRLLIQKMVPRLLLAAGVLGVFPRLSGGQILQMHRGQRQRHFPRIALACERFIPLQSCLHLSSFFFFSFVGGGSIAATMFCFVFCFFKWVEAQKRNYTFTSTPFIFSLPLSLPLPLSIVSQVSLSHSLHPSFFHLPLDHIFSSLSSFFAHCCLMPSGVRAWAFCRLL